MKNFLFFLLLVALVIVVTIAATFTIHYFYKRDEKTIAQMKLAEKTDSGKTKAGLMKICEHIGFQSNSLIGVKRQALESVSDCDRRQCWTEWDRYDDVDTGTYVVTYHCVYNTYTAIVVEYSYIDVVFGAEDTVVRPILPVGVGTVTVQ